MDVFQAHKARVAELQNTLESVMKLEVEYHEVCAESWDLQREYTPETIKALHLVHGRMKDKAQEILVLREKLGPIEPATSTKNFPIQVGEQEKILDEERIAIEVPLEASPEAHLAS